MTGYATTPKFQKIGLSGESAKWKLDTRIERMISVHACQKGHGGRAAGEEGRHATNMRLTHFQLRKLEATKYTIRKQRAYCRSASLDLMES